MSSADGTRGAGVVVAVAAGIAAAALWAGGSVVSRHLAMTGAHPADLALIRYGGCFVLAIAAVAFWPAARPRIPLARLAVLLMLAGPLYQGLLLAGYGHASAGAGALLVTGLMPIVACVIARYFSEKPPPASTWTGTLIAVAGVWIFARELDAAHLDHRGVAVFVTAAFLWALLGHFVRKWQIDPLQLTVALALWSPAFLPFWFVTSPGAIGALPWQSILLQAIYHGGLVAFGATLLYFVAVRRAGAETAGCLQATTPALAAAFGAVLLGEPFGLAHGAGAALVTLGLVIAVDGDRLAQRIPGLGVRRSMSAI